MVWLMAYESRYPVCTHFIDDCSFTIGEIEIPDVLFAGIAA